MSDTNKKKAKKSKNKIDPLLIHHEKILDQIILDTINAIGENCNLHFGSFEEAIENDNPSLFVKYLLKDDESSQQILQKIISSSNRNKIKSVIEHLKTKDPKFKVLLFDFEDSNFIESSSISFYTNLLDFFFLKKSKQELYDRCYTLLFGKYKNGDFYYMPYNDDCGILRSWSTYDKLITFVNNEKARFYDDQHQIIQMLTDDFKSKVKRVISEEYLRQIPPNVVPNVAYYQLQLIFDALDKQKSSHFIVESFLIAKRKFNQVKIPKTSILVNSVRAKYISLILQDKKYKEIMNETENNETNTKKNEEQKQTFYDEYAEFLSLNSTTEKTSKEIELEEEVSKLLNKNNNKNQIEQKPLLYNDGVLYAEEFIDDDKWEDFKSYIIKDQKIRIKTTPYFIKKAKNFTGNQFPVYKLFIYDENSNEWIFNKDGFDALDQDTKCFSDIKRIPLISFIESSTNQSFEILKNLYSNQLDNFEFKSDEICVFAICSKLLFDIRFENNIFEKDKTNKKESKPLFMILYVPEDKKELANLDVIIYHIYLFIGVISDANICLIDKKKCFDQTRMIGSIQSIKESLSWVSNDKKVKKKSEEEEEEDNYSDFDYDEGIQDKNDELNIINFKKEQLSDLNADLLYFSLKFFLLFNGAEYTCYKQKKDPIFSELLSNIGYYVNTVEDEICFIDLKDISTYENFVNDLIKYVENSENDRSLIYSKFELIKHFHMEKSYIYLRLNVNWDEKLKDIYKSKFSELINNDDDNDIEIENYLSCFTIVHNEICSIIPSWDFKCFKECNFILEEIKNKIVSLQICRFSKKIRLDSVNHIKSLLKLIDSRPYWSKEQLDDLKFSHFDFLKDEYYQMILNLCSSDNIADIYTNSKELLDNQINEDKEKITKIFDEIENKMRPKLPREVDPKKGTNYAIREKENEREIKVRIQKFGKLEDILKQDF